MDKKDLGDFLVAEGIVSSNQLTKAQERQMVMGGRLDTELLDMGAVHEGRLLEAVAKFYRARSVAGSALVQASSEVIRLIPPRMAVRFGVVPFRLEGRKLSVASVEPTDVLVEDELNLVTDCLVSTYVCLEIRLYEALARFYKVAVPTRFGSLVRRLATGAVRPEEVPVVSLPETRPPVEPIELPAPEFQHMDIQYAPSLGPVDFEIPEKLQRILDEAETPTELELSDDELAQFPSIGGVAEAGAEVRKSAPPQVVTPETGAIPVLKELTDEGTPEERLAVASSALTNAEMRDDIADALLGFCQPYLKRRMLLISREKQIVGWRGEGDGVDEESVRAVSIPMDDPSVFSGLSQGQPFWLGPLPSMPRNADLVLGLGGQEPQACVIIPVVVRSKTVCYLYGDNTGDGVAAVPMAELRRLVVKAGLAFQVYILKSKIRRM
jgi:hypothetical protein